MIIEYFSFVLIFLAICAAYPSYCLIESKAKYKELEAKYKELQARKDPSSIKTIDAQHIIRDLLTGEAVVRIIPISPEDIFWRSPK